MLVKVQDVQYEFSFERKQHLKLTWRKIHEYRIGHLSRDIQTASSKNRTFNINRR